MPSININTILEFSESLAKLVLKEFPSTISIFKLSVDFGG